MTRRTGHFASLCLAPALAGWLAVAPAAGQQAGQEDLPDWLPAAIELPEGHEVLRDTSVGSTNRLMLVELPGDAAPLFERWREALAESGYQVDAQPDVVGSDQFVFSGQGIRTGQVVLMPGASEDVSLVQIDATLNP